MRFIMGSETEINGYDEIPYGVASSQPIDINVYNSNLPLSSNGVCVNNNGDDRSTIPSSPVTAVTETDCVSYVPVCINENDVIEGAKQILTAIRSHWDLKFVQFKKFTDGITNKLIGCFYNPPTFCCNKIACTNTANGYPDVDDLNNVVLIRVYGNKTDLLIDREKEIENIKLLHSYQFAPSLYATFKNGLAYEFVPGVTLNPDNVLQPELWSLVAKRMAEMHRIVNAKDTSIQPMPMLLKKMERFFDLVPSRFSKAQLHKRLEGTFLPVERMRQEFAQLYKRLETLNSPVVFSHNDLLLGNIVYTQDLQKVTFIDYEYADYNFQAFDIGNHFAEFAGVDTVDYTRYPNREFQLKWLRVYLENYLLKTDITVDEIECLYMQVNQFALAAHFFWTIWSLVQAEYSTIDFDYAEYAFLRYQEYLAKKDEFLALNYQN
ncbi:ethanolamine kinase [Glossina fuscipes]|uniref:ethanolamine kinase n=1 Tax=Glossina fuscipes TaxID=7396 RepID=A0A9C6E1N4_9MUSC|nr:ethanolamine kinase [Glossina fuscipes]